jgi:ribosome recycling factor
MPPLTEERRKELVKVVHKEPRPPRVAVRTSGATLTHLKELLKAKSVSATKSVALRMTSRSSNDRRIGDVDKALHGKRGSDGGLSWPLAASAPQAITQIR